MALIPAWKCGLVFNINQGTNAVRDMLLEMPLL